MAYYDFYVLIRLLPPVFLVWTMWAVARAPYQVKSNRLLAAFLGVVAVGFTIEAAWTYSKLFYATGAPPFDKSIRLVQDIPGLLDPPLMLAFALSVPDPRRLRRTHALWLFYAAAAVGIYLGLVAFRQGGDSVVSPWTNLALLVYVNATYLAAFLLLLVAYVRETRRYLSRQMFFLSVGIGFVALSRSAHIFTPGIAPGWSWWPYTAPQSMLFGLLTAVTIAGIVWALSFAGAAKERRRAAAVLAATTALLLVFFAIWFIAFVATQPKPLGVEFFGLRWIVFAAVVGYGILRYQILDIELRSRDALALLTTIGVGLVLAIASGLYSQDQGLSRSAAVTLGLLVGLACAWPLYFTASRLLAGMAPGLASPIHYTQRRLEIYEAALEYSGQGKESRDEERLFMGALREVFEITPEEHERLLAKVKKDAARQGLDEKIAT